LAGIEAALKSIADKREHLERLERDFHALSAEVTALENERRQRAEAAARILPCPSPAF
jgi:hypothetical protein